LLAVASRLGLLSSLLLLSLISCNSTRAVTDGGLPPAGEIGSECAEDTVCKSGFCLTDPSFGGGYCTQDCGSDPTCPDGSTCQTYGSYKFCLDGCSTDDECREGYVCDYHVCRPRCTRNDLCTTPDQCFKGRCMAGCQKDTDCSGKLCDNGKCVAPCKTDDNCTPGFSCNTTTGRCVAKPGKAMGQACGGSGECATAYCLPYRRICSVKCTSTTACPTGYVCGAERFDKDGGGTFDSIEADCVPIKGKGAAGASCDKDDACASSHCYSGICMEGCAADADCGALQCVSVNVLLEGGIPKYKGCLPRQGVFSSVLATVQNGAIKGVDIPPNASSFVLSTEVNSTTEYALIANLTDPSNATISELPGGDVCAYYSQPIRYYPQEQISSIYVPNTPAVAIKPGLYTYAVQASQPTLPVTVRLMLKLGSAQKGSLNINWFFLDLSGTCVPGATLNAASAPTHAWMSKLRNNLVAILKGAGLTVTKETFQDLKNAALNNIEESATGLSTSVQQLFASSKGMQGNALNVFFVRKISIQGVAGGVILGQAGGIPGPIGLHGYVHSGLMISMETACFEQYGYNPSHTVAHEMGHYLGLFHNQESEGEPGLDDSNKVVCPCPCKGYLGCQSDFTRSWCRGEDPIPDTTTTDKNLMFYAAESTQMFDGNQLSAGQIRVMLDNPLVGH
jgi:hypothetical protein